MGTEIETGYISPMFAVDAKSAVEVHVADVYAENGHRYSHRGYRAVTLAPVFDLHQVEEAANRWSDRRDGFETDYVAPVFDHEDVSVRTVTVKVTTAADVSEDDLHRGRQVADKVTLRGGEQITGTSIKDVTKYTVKAVAPKGASKTKHFVTIPGMTIPEWSASRLPVRSPQRRDRLHRADRTALRGHLHHPPRRRSASRPGRPDRHQARLRGHRDHREVQDRQGQRLGRLLALPRLTAPAHEVRPC